MGIISIGIGTAGSPMMFIDFASLFFVLVPLPVLLILSGLEIRNLPEFFLGIFSLSLVQKKNINSFLKLSKQAGYFVLLLGILAVMISCVVLLSRLDEPDMLGPVLAVALISAFYGVGFKIVVFDPYTNLLGKIRKLQSADAEEPIE